MPKGSVVLRTAVVQNGTICLYAQVNPAQTEMALLEVGILGTGWDIPNLPLFDSTNYLTTVMDEVFV